MEPFAITNQKTELSNITVDFLLDPNSYLDEQYKDLHIYDSDATLELKLIFHRLILAGEIVCEINKKSKL